MRRADLSRGASAGSPPGVLRSDPGCRRRSGAIGGRPVKFSMEPGAIFSGMLPSGKSAYITPEQQRGFMEHVFGVSKSYRMAGTGKFVTPEQLSRVKIMPSASEMDFYATYGNKEKFKAYLETQIEKETGLARKERGGWSDVSKANVVNPYEYNIGRPGRRKPSLTVEDSETFFEGTVT